jgi:hypothetical protein
VVAVPEPRFTALAEHLESQVRQPAFDTVLHRRRRRTQRLATLSSAGLVVALLLAGGLALRLLPGHQRPAPASPSPSASPAAAGPLPALVNVFVVNAGGVLFGINGVAGANRVPSLIRSDDFGRHWTTVTTLSWLTSAQGTQIRGGAAGLWIFDQQSGILAYTGDQGRTFRQWPMGSVFVARSADETAGVEISPDGGVLWGRIGNRIVLLDPQTGTPVTRSEPAGLKGYVVPLSAQRAVAGPGQGGAWYLTADGGVSWQRTSAPCAHTGFPHAAVLNIAQAADSLWVGCQSAVSSSTDPVEFVASTDGRSWQSRGRFADDSFVVPVSAMVGWRFQPTSGAVYRMSDGATWQPATALPAEGLGTSLSCSAVDSQRARCLSGRADGTGSALRVAVTADGGTTWTVSQPEVN